MARIHHKKKCCWLFRNDQKTWQTFAPEDSKKLEQAVASYSDGMVLQRNHGIYYIDFDQYTQTNTDTGRVRPVQRIRSGSQWMFENSACSVARQGTNSNGGGWSAFTKEVRDKLETALFNHEECVILELGDDTLFVDLQRWTITNLTTNVSCAIQVGDERKCRARRNSLTASSKQEIAYGGARNDQEHNRPSFKSAIELKESSECSDSERTASTYLSPESSECESGSRSIPTLSLGRINADSPLWMWRNNEGLWSTFDDDVIGDIERAFKRGETGMIMNLGPKTEPFFLDLVEMTQTNLSTGFVRNIERRVDW